MKTLPWLGDDDDFPPLDTALADPNGLLAVGGSLTPERLERAYRRGIFPWYSAGQPVLWWSPDPRTVLFPSQLKVSRSLCQRIRNGGFSITLDQAFPAVIAACAALRPSQSGTWITDEIRAAYTGLHHRGLAHSVEVWLDGELIGGLYGVAIGRAFFGESMFALRRDASKVGFAWLATQLQRWGYRFIDCQVHTEHLASLGAVDIPRSRFVALLAEAVGASGAAARWHFDEGHDPLAGSRGATI